MDRIEEIKRIILDPTELVKKLYNRIDDKEKVDVLIPVSRNVLKPHMVFQDKQNHNKVEWAYRWNERKNMFDDYSEFIQNKRLNLDATLRKGTRLDRIGGEDGRYLCIIKQGRKPFTVAERALPYYFKGDVKTNPSYHTYIVLKDVSFLILDKDDQFKKRFVNEYDIMNLLKSKFVVGEIAPVKAFGGQGKGGGLQVRLPDSLSVGVLKELEYLVSAH